MFSLSLTTIFEIVKLVVKYSPDLAKAIWKIIKEDVGDTITTEQIATIDALLEKDPEDYFK